MHVRLRYRWRLSFQRRSHPSTLVHGTDSLTLEKSSREATADFDLEACRQSPKRHGAVLGFRASQPIASEPPTT